jgi:GTP cyclohydrolase II
MEAETATLTRRAASCCCSDIDTECQRGGTATVHDFIIVISLSQHDFKLNKVAEADFPSRFGRFRIYGFEGVRPEETEEAIALQLGDLSAALGPPLVRIHSQCLTGDVFHSLRCDCRSQLELALDQIVNEGRGLLIYEHQEGRGIGLLNKLRAYELQDEGLDTVEANEKLGFEADLRDYALPAAILQYFQVKQVRLLSNNPDKVAALEKAGIQVVERAPIVVPPLDTTAEYLRTKREKLGHLF